jgi:hypothetical protein
MRGTIHIGHLAISMGDSGQLDPQQLGLISRPGAWQQFSVAAVNLVVISRWGDFAVWESL